jgi:hypothetical protein
LHDAERKHSARFELPHHEREEITMKVSTITLPMMFALSSGSVALAQSNDALNKNMTRSSTNVIPATHSQQRVHHAAVDGPNGHGISHLGVTTNPGRMYNGA